MSQSSHSHGSVVVPLTHQNLTRKNNKSRGKVRPYRRDSRSTIDFSEISDKSINSLWKRSISASNEARVSNKYIYAFFHLSSVITYTSFLSLYCPKIIN
jgi:hypothetical protein